MNSSSSYRLVRSQSTAAVFHARTVPEPALREIWLLDAVAPALVLGSTQDRSVADVDACRRAGVDIVRRRSGGGAVLVVPDEVTWIDVVVPAGSTGWSDDVHGPMVWLGGHLAAAITTATGASGIDVHDGPMRTSAWSKLVCFDGVGAGEVLVGGHKLVGISQRRTRHAARLQCCWYSTYEPARLVELLAPPLRPALDELAPVATLPAAFAETIVAALVARL